MIDSMRAEIMQLRNELEISNSQLRRMDDRFGGGLGSALVALPVRLMEVDKERAKGAASAGGRGLPSWLPLEFVNEEHEAANVLNVAGTPGGNKVFHNLDLSEPEEATIEEAEEDTNSGAIFFYTRVDGAGVVLENNPFVKIYEILDDGTGVPYDPTGDGSVPEFPNQPKDDRPRRQGGYGAPRVARGDQGDDGDGDGDGEEEKKEFPLVGVFTYCKPDLTVVCGDGE